MIILLPKDLRIEVVNNENLTCPVGTRATVSCEQNIDTEYSSGVFVLIDNDHMVGMLPFGQCKIITDNFKKTFKPQA